MQKTQCCEFFNLLSSDRFKVIIAEFFPDYRERLFSPTLTFSLFLAQAVSEDRSCQKIVNQVDLQKLINDP